MCSVLSSCSVDAVVMARDAFVCYFMKSIKFQSYLPLPRLSSILAGSSSSATAAGQQPLPSPGRGWVKT